jgi:hypothetical protein
MGVQLQATSFQSQLSIKQIVQLYAGLCGILSCRSARSLKASTGSGLVTTRSSSLRGAATV